MKKLIAGTFGSGALAVMLAGLGLFLAINTAQARATFPDSRPTGQARFGLGSLVEGRMSQTGSYWTSAELMNVWRWYEQHFELAEPGDETVNERAGCLTILASQEWRVARRTLQATLCSTSPGTSVFLYQAVSLAH